MELTWSDEDRAFRAEVIDFLSESLTSELKAIGRGLTSVYSDKGPAIAWQRILHAKGWAAAAWPTEYGGCGWSSSKRYIFTSELAAAGAPPLSPMGLGMCGPVLIGHGTTAQKQRFLPPMLSGDEFWCQGYSEPASGSDLASLRMSARLDGDHFVCNGHKIWTTHANVADWIFCLVRTSEERIRQLGITFILIDMRTPGVEVRPIISLSGEHIQNEVFFSDARVPTENVVGAVGDGWTVAKYLMQFERGGGVSAPGLRQRLAKLRIMSADLEGFSRRVAEAAIEVEALEAVELRVMSALSAGEAPGPESSMLKTLGTELSQKLTELTLEAAGVYAAPFQPHAIHPGGPTPGFVPPNDGFAAGPSNAWTVSAKYLNDRAGSIYAGTNEIQRNIMAKAILGL